MAFGFLPGYFGCYAIVFFLILASISYRECLCVHFVLAFHRRFGGLWDLGGVSQQTRQVNLRLASREGLAFWDGAGTMSMRDIK
jgi:hypothetical protein